MLVYRDFGQLPVIGRGIAFSRSSRMINILVQFVSLDARVINEQRPDSEVRDPKMRGDIRLRLGGVVAVQHCVDRVERTQQFCREGPLHLLPKSFCTGCHVPGARSRGNKAISEQPRQFKPAPVFPARPQNKVSIGPVAVQREGKVRHRAGVIERARFNAGQLREFAAG